MSSDGADVPPWMVPRYADLAFEYAWLAKWPQPERFARFPQYIELTTVRLRALTLLEEGPIFVGK